MEEAFRWWLASTAIGAAGLWPALAAGARTRSGGLCLARPIGLAILAVTAWLLARAEAAPWGSGTAWLLLGGLAAASAAALARDRDLRRRLIARRKLLLRSEALFAVLFLLLSITLSQDARADRGERLMNLMLIQAVHRSETMPPPDPWLAGHDVSYHHLGHFAADFAGRVAGTPSETTFTFAAVLALAAAASAAGGAALDLAALGPRRRAGRFRSDAAAQIGGAAAWLFAMPWIAAFVALAGFASGAAGEHWWNAALLPWGDSVISHLPPNLVLGLFPHAFVLASPFLLTAVALAAAAVASPALPSWRRRPAALAAASFVLAALAMSNGWDVPFACATLAAAAWFRRARGSEGFPAAARRAAVFAAVPAAAAVLLATPWAATLASAGTARLEPVSADPGAAMPWVARWIGPLALPFAAWLGVRETGAARGRSPRRAALPVAAGCAAAIAAWAAIQAVSGNAGALAERGYGGWLLLALLTALAAAFAGGAARAHAAGERALAVCCALPCALLLATLIVELWNFDLPRPSGIHYRNNIGRASQWHAWALAALAAGCAWGVAPRRWPSGRWSRRIVNVLAAGFVASCLLVPAAAVQRSGEPDAATPNALAHLRDGDPAAAGAVGFARAHLDPRRHVIVEGACTAGCTAAGGMNAVSAASGVPAIVGWEGHVEHWHGAGSAQGRATLVARLFADPDDGGAHAPLRRLGATHVWIGRWEEFAYGPGVRRRFREWPVAFEGEGGALLRFAPPP